MIDTHTHLELCAGDDGELVAAATAAGVERMLTIGLDGASTRAALAAAEALPQVWAAAGRHPNSAAGWNEAALAELRALAAHPRCAAIGETGLDFFRAGAPRADQERAFRDQIGLARETGLPLVVHSRDAAEDTLRILTGNDADGLRVVLHCFSMPERVEECVAHGWWISFAGNTTYPRNAELRAAARAVPAERLLVETDAPFLTPQPVRKERNQPAFVVHTARVLAEERGVAYEELERDVAASAAALFSW